MDKMMSLNTELDQQSNTVKELSSPEKMKAQVETDQLLEKITQLEQDLDSKQF